MKKLTTEEFIERAKKIHGNKYDYSKVNVVKAHEKVLIICPIHGEFLMTPSNHLSSQGCPKCRYVAVSEKLSDNKDSFCEKAKIIHGNKYDYSKLNYANNRTKVCIICPIHGEFWQSPNKHLMGQGCPYCGKEKIGYLKRGNKELFVRKANKIHNGKYDYSKVEYINAHTKVCIICKEHGEFWQTPSDHLSKRGCPLCKFSKLENDIRIFLEANKIKYATQKRFKWLGNLSLDFYLPEYNIGIECQGDQHFMPVTHFGGINGLNKTIYRDELKRTRCLENNVLLLYFSNSKIDFPYDVITEKNNLLKKIKTNEK